MKSKNFVILTNKKWHFEIAKILNKKYKSKRFIIIKSKEDLTLKKLNQLKPEYIFVPHWSYRIPKKVYNNFKTVVFHMTDLPFGRGGSPLQNLILIGKKKSMISAIECSRKIDAGNIYLKSPINIEGSAQEIYDRSTLIIKEMIIKIINNKFVLRPQRGKITRFKRRSPLQGNLIRVKSMQTFYNFIRMLDAETYPKAFLKINGFTILFSKVKKVRTNKLIAEVEISRK